MKLYKLVYPSAYTPHHIFKERKKERREAYALAANGHPKKKTDPGTYLQPIRQHHYPKNLPYEEKKNKERKNSHASSPPQPLSKKP